MIQLIPAYVDGVLTPVEKMDVHRRGLRHLAISVFVMRGTEVLLQRRALSKYHTPGLWTNTCCTHPLWGEDAVDCARRRLREELGITEVAPWVRDKVEYRAEVGNGLIEHEVVDILLADATPGMTIAPNPDEVCATRWIDLYDLDAELRRWPDRFTPWLQIYMAEHRELIFGVWESR